MVQPLLTRWLATFWTTACFSLIILLSLSLPCRAAHVKVEDKAAPQPPDLLLEGGRKLTFERIFETDRDVGGQRGFWTKLLDLAIGEPTRHRMLRPYSIAIDSRGRAIVTDPGAKGVHIYDFVRHKYKFVSREDKDENSLRSPQCVAVDAEDNFYVTESESGRIFIFDSNGKFKRIIGALRGGEGFFKRPTGIAVDSAANQIYVTDTGRNKVFILDMQGHVLQTIGKAGNQPGEFNFPTEVLLHGKEIAVVDAMNFRVQVFDRAGAFQYSVGGLGDGLGSLFRPKGIGFDSEGHLYVVDAALNNVQVFDRQGELLYYFGARGSEAGAFVLPAGLFIDRDSNVYVVDSFNRRVQVFRYYGNPTEAAGK